METNTNESNNEATNEGAIIVFDDQAKKPEQTAADNASRYIYRFERSIARKDGTAKPVKHQAVLVPRLADQVRQNYIVPASSTIKPELLLQAVVNAFDDYQEEAAKVMLLEAAADGKQSISLDKLRFAELLQAMTSEASRTSNKLKRADIVAWFDANGLAPLTAALVAKQQPEEFILAFCEKMQAWLGALAGVNPQLSEVAQSQAAKFLALPEVAADTSGMVSELAKRLAAIKQDEAAASEAL
jgi:hypothetical protein